MYCHCCSHHFTLFLSYFHILLCSSFSFDRFKVSLLRPFIEMRRKKKQKTDEKLSIQFTLLCSRASLCSPATTKLLFLAFLSSSLMYFMNCDVVWYAVGTSVMSYTMWLILYFCTSFSIDLIYAAHLEMNEREILVLFWSILCHESMWNPQFQS